MNMLDILINEFGPNGCLNEIVGNPKLDATAILEVLTVANYKFVLFVNSQLKMLGKQEIFKENMDCTIEENINHFRIENLEIFKFVKCAEAFMTTFSVLAELHTICNELIVCLDNYKQFVQ